MYKFKLNLLPRDLVLLPWNTGMLCFPTCYGLQKLFAPAFIYFIFVVFYLLFSLVLVFNIWTFKL